jgi:hypothetical protein
MGNVLCQKQTSINLQIWDAQHGTGKIKNVSNAQFVGLSITMENASQSPILAAPSIQKDFALPASKDMT